MADVFCHTWAASSLNWNEAVKVVQASDQNTFQMLPRLDVSGMSIKEGVLVLAQDLLERLYLSPDLGTAGGGG